MDFTGRLVAGFLALILVILFPLQYIAQSNSENIDSLMDDRTKSLSDSIRSKGYLDTAMYEEYVNFLDTTGELYDVEIEDIHPVTGDETSLSEAPNNGYKTDSTKKCRYNCNQSGNMQAPFNLLSNRKSYILQSLQNINTSKAILEINSLKNTNSIQILSAHTHTDACYAGHRHTESGCPSVKCYTGAPITSLSKYSFYQEDNSSSYLTTQLRCDRDNYCVFAVSKTSSRNYAYTRYGTSISSSSGYLPEDSNKGSYWSYGRREEINVNEYFISIDYKAGYINSGYGYWVMKNPEWDKYNTAFETFYNNKTLDINSAYTLGYNPAYSCCNCLVSGRIPMSLQTVWLCGQAQDETPICDRVVVNISPNSSNQAIIQGGSIDTAAVAAMLDGSTKTVNCTASAFDNNTPGTYTVILTYSGLVGNAKTTGTRTCTMTVTVKNSKTLSFITAAPATQTINCLGTPSFSVTAYYSDGTSKALSAGQYTISGFNASVPGAQTVTLTFSENGITKSAAVTVCVDGLTSISVNPTVLTVERYADMSALSFTITAAYLYGSSRVITSGYVVSGYSPSVIGQQNVTVSYTENGVTKEYPVIVNVTVLHKVCPHCSNTYDLNMDDSDPGCPFCRQLIKEISATPDYVEVVQGKSLPVTVQAVYYDGTVSVVYGWISNYDPNKTGLQLVTIEYGGFAADISVWVEEAKITCQVCGTQYPASLGRCPVCAANVVSITVSPSTITVNQNEPINLTVTAYFADGSSDIVTDWSIDRTSSEPGTFTARVSYKNASTTITLTVIAPESAVCPICGQVYDPTQNPKGCPVCSALITGIEAYMTTGSNLVQLGSNPGIAVILIFRDTHRELTTEGYTLENYDAHTLGAQTVTVRYDIFSTTIEIIVVNTLSSITCPNGHVYYRNEDGSDPGCPYCAMSDNPETVYYFDITYFSEIINRVYTDGIYYFNKGNFITVLVIKKNASVLTKIQNMFFKTSILGRIKRYVYGGEVL